MNSLPQPYRRLVEQTLQPTLLPADDRFVSAWHSWSDAERAAVVQAWASGRPLLVRGEAGCGKSQLARAAAAVLDVPLIAEVIHPRFEATDLLYREDPVERLAQAQLIAAIKPQTSDAAVQLRWLKEQLAPEQFIRHGPVWHAMEAPPPTDKGERWPRAVILIDEIDKADSDVPNALLEVLGNRSFSVPGRSDPVRCDLDHAPLIIITTNEDRELPPAFLRRCAVLNMRPDDASETEFVPWLLQRTRAHAALAVLDGDASSPMARAAAQVWADRKAATAQGLPSVGLAECLDLLYSLLYLSDGDPARANALLAQVAPFALVKHRELDQKRPPVDRPDDSD